VVISGKHLQVDGAVGKSGERADAGASRRKKKSRASRIGRTLLRVHWTLWRRRPSRGIMVRTLPGGDVFRLISA